MSLLKERDGVYSKAPFFNNNRKENFLIEVDGIFLPEADLIFYGLLNSDISDQFPFIRDTNIIVPKDIYYELAYYAKEDLIKYVSGCSYDNMKEFSLPIDDIYNIAEKNYNYVPCNETVMRHAVIEAAMFDFVQSITLVFNKEVTDIDLSFIDKLIPPKIKSKIIIASGNLLEVVKENGGKTSGEFEYSTIITNSISDINTMLDDRETYNIKNTLFLLRNHSGNTIMKRVCVDGSESVEFEEIGTEKVLSKITDSKSGLPNCAIRFGRFEPLLFNIEINEDTQNLM